MEYDRSTPFELRCRASLQSMVSQYSTAEAAAQNSPAPSKHNIRLTLQVGICGMTSSFQQHLMGNAASEAIIMLLRPYFVECVGQEATTMLESPYASAYLAVIERCIVSVRDDSSNRR